MMKLNEITDKKQEQIYEFFKKRAIKINHFFGRELILISINDFKKQKRWFEQSSGSFHKKKDLRTRKSLKHIHAVKNTKYVEVHYDYGNTNKNPLTFIIHFIIDVIPYFFYHLIKGKKPYEIKP